ncbi:SAM-dependent methyltransferase [Pedobacter sp. SYP-B3415]|uniref:class I SAM-dependent methyltransferase n=1 Tax=Pedobacter sp. SYP-B3415 TaxID=2496641 RepID=UPI001F0EE67D|nr:SAM-dependent methyltransferase [Pedobacter sp. SYP-B3415]
MMSESGTSPETFASRVAESLHNKTFVKLSFGNYRGEEPELKQVLVREVEIKRKQMLAFTFRYRSRDIVKNFTLDEGTDKAATLLNSGFRIATHFSTTADFIIEYRERTGWSARQQQASRREKPSVSHDHAKKRLITAGSKPYLHALGITGSDGQVLKSAQDKYKQINHYIELLDPLIREAGTIRHVADMGSGKGYLTFALYDYLKNVLETEATVTGVEYRQDLVDLCNAIAAESNFESLSFVPGSISDYNAAGTDLLIALHACDTATDDAVYKGIEAGAKLIVVAPCCHKEVRREMERNKAVNQVSFLTRYGIFLERQAEMVTDGLRALLLEYAGYKTRVFQFISDSHTPKNVLVVGIKAKEPTAADRVRLLDQINTIKADFGIKRQHLEQLLFSK